MGITDGAGAAAGNGYRANLINDSGVNPGGFAQAHHIIPQQFADDVPEGLDINSSANLSWLTPAEHQAIHAAGYNAEWSAWLSNNAGASIDEWWAQAQYMASQYGIPMAGG